MKTSHKLLYHFPIFLLTIPASVFLLFNFTNEDFYSLTGKTIIVSAFIITLYLFLLHFRKEVLGVARKVFFLVLMILTFLTITRLITDNPGFSVYIIPFALIPLIIRTFYDAHLAMFMLLITLFLCCLIIPHPFEFAVLTFISGTIAIFTFSNIFNAGKYLFTAFIIFLTYSVVYVGAFLFSSGNIDQLSLVPFKSFMVNGSLILLSYPIIFLFEKKFYFLSDSSLIELTDINNQIMRRFSEEAPGSFQHSLQVAVLAEEAARKIGANSLLSRAGSLYHDIGKTANPEYFIENPCGKISPHESISPLSSAGIIINHVTSGVEIAHKQKLPVQITDFIRTHHGTSLTYYFYKKYLTENNGDDEIKKYFTYPGPKPFTKETVIVMMADAVEAASRTLESYSEETVKELVDRIIYLQEADGQFSDAPLTFKDISDIKDVFVRRLLNMYHSRIAYPGRQPY